jgi:hypothetical protein
MNTQAEKLVQCLFAEVWTPMDSSKLNQFYHQAIVAEMGAQTAHFQDIINRLNYCQKHYSRLQNDIEDMISVDDKVAVRMKQTCIAKDPHKKDEVFHIIFIYQLKDEKINRIWAEFNPSFNYLEKA